MHTLKRSSDKEHWWLAQVGQHSGAVKRTYAPLENSTLPRILEDSVVGPTPRAEEVKGLGLGP